MLLFSPPISFSDIYPIQTLKSYINFLKEKENILWEIYVFWNARFKDHFPLKWMLSTRDEDSFHFFTIFESILLPHTPWPKWTSRKQNHTYLPSISISRDALRYVYDTEIEFTQSIYTYSRIAVASFDLYMSGPWFFCHTHNIIVLENRNPVEIFRHQHHLDHHQRIKNFQLGIRKPRLDLLLDDWKVQKLEEIFKYVCDFWP